MDGMQQFSGYQTRNAEQVLSQPLQLPQVACDKRTGEEPKDVVSFGSSNSDICKRYSKSRSYQRNELVDLPGSDLSSPSENRIDVCSLLLPLAPSGKRQQQACVGLDDAAKRPYSQTVEDVRRALLSNQHNELLANSFLSVHLTRMDGMQQFSGYQTRNAEQVLSQPLQLPQVACDKRTGEEPKDVVSFGSSNSDICKRYSKSRSYQRNELVDLPGSDLSSPSENRIDVCSLLLPLAPSGKRQQQACVGLDDAAKRPYSQTVEDVRRALLSNQHNELLANSFLSVHLTRMDGMQQFSGYQTRNAEQVLSQPLQLPQVACDKRTGEEPKDVVSFGSSNSDICKRYSKSRSYQRNELENLLGSDLSSPSENRIEVCSLLLPLAPSGKRQQQACVGLDDAAKRPCSQTVEDVRRALLSNQHNSWHVHGVADVVVTQISSEAYHAPTFTTSCSIQNLFGKKQFILLRKTESVNPKDAIRNCCQELDHNLSLEWHSTEGLVTSRSDLNRPVHSQSSSIMVNWTNGVESGIHKCSYLSTANADAKKYTANKPNARVLDCRRSPAEYLSVDLSDPPSDWDEPFRQVKIIADAMPRLSAEYHRKGLIHIAIRKSRVLGSLSRAEETQGLMARMSYSFKSTEFERILDMHTVMQIHAFVPRIYAMHMCVSPLENEKCSAVFVGETPGSWNLGNSGGLLYSKQEECQVMAYHVTLCLIRIQILTYMKFGITLRCIQPARLYRHGFGFRPDMIACLIDSLHPKIHSDQRADDVDLGMREQRAKEGICSIRQTLVKLGLLAYLPQEAKDLILNVESWVRYGVNPPGGLCDEMSLLTHFYQICFGEPVQLDSYNFLGQQRDYKSHIINSTTGSVQPYGPFAIDVLQKPYAWNQVVIVEPKMQPRKLATAGQGPTKPRVKNSAVRRAEDPSSSQSPGVTPGGLNVTTEENSFDNSASRSVYTAGW